MRFTIQNLLSTVCIFYILLSMGCGGNDPQIMDYPEVNAAEYFSTISNTVKSADMGNGEHIVSYYDFDIGKDPTTQFFQIGISKNNGQTYRLLVPDSTDASTIIPDARQAYPSSLMFSDKTILLSVVYRINSDPQNQYVGTFKIDRATLNFTFIPQNQTVCTPIDGIENADSSWLLAGSCDGNATIYTTDANLANPVVLVQLTSNSHGGQFVSMLSASDGCIYVGGHNWGIINEQAATHIVIRRSCNQGDTWLSDFDFYNAGHAYTSIRRLYEFNKKIQFYGHVGEDPVIGRSTDVTVVTAARNGANDWTFTRLPNATVGDASPAYYIAFEPGSCNMASASLLTDFITHISLSKDCGVSWGNPIATEFGRMTGLEINSDVVTFFHYGSQFVAQKINFTDIEITLNPPM